MSDNNKKKTEGIITGITDYGAFVRLTDKRIGMIHISEVTDDYLDDISKILRVGDKVEVRILSISKDGKLSLSLKNVDIGELESQNEAIKQVDKKENKDSSFEDMIAKFKRTSEEKISELKRGENRGYSRRKGNRR